MSDQVITARQLSKTYKLYRRPLERVIETFHPLGKVYHTPFEALKNVSFSVSKGDSFGIIGKNGSGKSTLLQLVCGILQPTSGEVDVHGRIAALLELGAGFDPEFSGRENVYLNGAILGFDRAVMDRRFEEIAAFADIGEHLEHPVKTYSSGMYIRLAFAVQTFLEPDILIVDEALSVGDIFFQQKCLRRLQELREIGTTLLFVSHDMGIVRELCNKAIFLDRGNVVYSGSSHATVQKYYENNTSPVVEIEPGEMAGEAVVDPVLPNQVWINTHPVAADDKGQIVAVAMEDRHQHPSMRAKIGEKVVFRVVYMALSDAPLDLTVSIKNRFDTLVACSRTYFCGFDSLVSEDGDTVVVNFIIPCNLEAGNYTLKFGLSTPCGLPNRGEPVAETPWIGPLSIEWDYEQVDAPFLGMVHLPLECSRVTGLAAKTTNPTL